MNSLFKKLLLSASVLLSASNAQTQGLDLEFDSGVSGWQTVLDGVMGGRSSGRVTSPEAGILRFAGDLSLENNGGFSQMRTTVEPNDFVGSDGIEIVVRGDGRSYKFDVRLSNVRMMAGAYQQDFETIDNEWSTIRLPFPDFRLYSFGRPVSNAPKLNPSNIESIGVTLSDKQAGAFSLEIDSIRTYSTEFANTTQPAQPDLVSAAQDAGLDTFLELVVASGLELPDEQVTIFAPTNEAFAGLPAEQVRKLPKPENADTLTGILTHHVAMDSINSPELLSRRYVTTLSGQRVHIATDGVVLVGGSKLLTADIPFDGGTIHVIDTVITPEFTSIATLTEQTSELSMLTAAINAAGLGEQLGIENGPWTVFAPLDSAFDELPTEVLQDLLKPGNRQQLIETLGLHVVPGRLYSNDLLAINRTQTLFGSSISFNIAAGQLQVNDANIVHADIQAANGVVHLIDSVLMPTAGNQNRSSASISADAAALCELAINRGAPLFNAGQYAGCASVYELTIQSMITLGSNSLDTHIIEMLETAIEDAERDNDWIDKAWTYRKALDDAYLSLIALSNNPD